MNTVAAYLIRLTHNSEIIVKSIGTLHVTASNFHNMSAIILIDYKSL